MAGSSHDDSLAHEPTLPELKPFSKTSTPEPSSGAVAGVKRRAPSLLPAFEPSSSPGLPRPLKRQNTGSHGSDKENGRRQLPTPVPTSSTGIMSSSPPVRRSDFVQSSSAARASERAPLGALPTLPAGPNLRLVSRVHVQAKYVSATNPLEPSKIEISCPGWNGLKLHSQGRTWELFKGDSFTSETEGTDIILDVLGSRVILQWPNRGADSFANMSDGSWDSPEVVGRRASILHSSPLRRSGRMASPESPTPAGLSSSQRLHQSLFSPREGLSIKIFEDEAEPELPEPVDHMDVNVSMRTEATASFSSELSEHDSEDDENDPDEENDPIVHSFGPFGANISGRFASISTRSPREMKRSPKPRASPFKTKQDARKMSLARTLFPEIPSSPLKPVREELRAKSETPEEVKEEEEEGEVKEETKEEEKPVVELNPSITNHVINQLAYSRLSSTPLSTILHNLPSDAKEGLTTASLRVAIESTACIGFITREGKDAAGKALESQYYYVPEFDTDEQRRAAVVDGLRKPSLRACRKQHKQYYWKRPKTP
ncbi:unnamed protein product [Clonostachys rosea f. rosea IK726]|uniref:FHA domain-containing protein n=2 Tax=Bionectria ochroleuca TaxID=29856 RepID=A0A0B7JME4_BIOOC|nr:unnamed protein product [Clonostachys rosea f. rosea IK726]